MTDYRPPEQSVLLGLLTDPSPKAMSGHTAHSLVGATMFDSHAPDGYRNLLAGIIHETSSSAIAKGRDEMADKFLTTQAEWLVMVDSDMVFPWDSIHALLSFVHPEERPVVGGLAFSGVPGDMRPTMYQFGEGNDTGPTVEVIVNYPADSLVRVDADTGAAFLAIHRGAFLDVSVSRWFDVVMQDNTGATMGEDIAFCRRLDEEGVPIHVHTGIRIGHHKSVVLDEDLYRDGIPASLLPTNAVG